MEALAPLDALAFEPGVQAKEFTPDGDLDTLFVIWATSLVLFMQVPLPPLLSAGLPVFVLCCQHVGVHGSTRTCSRFTGQHCRIAV